MAHWIIFKDGFAVKVKVSQKLGGRRYNEIIYQGRYDIDERPLSFKDFKEGFKDFWPNDKIRDYYDLQVPKEVREKALDCLNNTPEYKQKIRNEKIKDLLG